MKTRKNIIKMLIVALGVTALLGVSTVTFAAGRDLVGRGTVIKATPVASADDTQSSSTQTTEKQTTGGAVSGKATEADSSGSNTTRAGGANTGIMDQLYPFLTVLSVAFLFFSLFLHLRLNQGRYALNQRHYREIDDFHWRMRHLED